MEYGEASRQQMLVDLKKVIDLHNATVQDSR